MPEPAQFDPLTLALLSGLVSACAKKIFDIGWDHFHKQAKLDHLYLSNLAQEIAPDQADKAQQILEHFHRLDPDTVKEYVKDVEPGT